MPRQERERNTTRREAYDDDDDDDPYKIYYTLGRNNEDAIKRQEENIRQIKKSILDNFKVVKCALVIVGCFLFIIVILLLVNTLYFHDFHTSGELTMNILIQIILYKIPIAPFYVFI